ncbi:MAG: GNAT family N-acetyltransferase [Pseudomonadota bacterium]
MSHSLATLNLEWFCDTFAELSPWSLYAILKLRQEVFVLEQDSLYLDPDGKDLDSTHIYAFESGELVAYQRCLPPGLSYPESSIGRIVTHPRMRGKQLGKALVQRGVEYNLMHWPGSDICISAQAHLQNFYASFGFTAEGESYQEDGIPHRKMRLRSA